MPWLTKKNGEKTCVYKKGADGQPEGDPLHCYDGDDQEEKAKEYMKALYANADQSMSMTNFLFVELSQKDDLKKIDGLAAGTFTAMSGQEVTFEASELPEWVVNTKAIIESTRTETGEIVGLPIDLNAHDHQGGAGWIVDLELDEARNVIRFIVKWTKAGIDLIAGNIRRFFSPSTEPNEKIVLGGSLTNWPATRDTKGRMLLRPVELSAQIKEIDMVKTLEELQADNEAKDKLIAQLQAAKPATETGDDTAELAELNSWMSGNENAVEELSKRAQQMAELQIKAQRRKDKVVEFASQIVGGTTDKPFGIPIRSSRIVKLLLSLPEKQAQEVQELLALTWKYSIDFAERGIDGSNFSLKPKLPVELASVAKLWVDSGKPIEAWFAEMGEGAVGKAEDYDLSMFQKVEES